MHLPTRRAASQALFLAAATVVLIGLGYQSTIMRQVGAPIATGSLLVLLLTRREAWLSTAYAVHVAFAVLLYLLADLIVLEPIQSNLHPLAFLLMAGGNMALAAAFWSPSVSTRRLWEPGVDLSWGAPAHLSARVPANFVRALPGMVLVAGIVLLVKLRGLQDSVEPLVDTSASAVAAVAFVVTQGLLLWRVLARVGYRSPTMSMALQLVRQQRAAGQPMAGGTVAAAAEAAAASSASRRFSAAATVSSASDRMEALHGSFTKRTDGGEAPASSFIEARLRGSATPSHNRSHRTLMNEAACGRILEAYGQSESMERRCNQWVGVLGGICVICAQVLGALAVWWGVGRDGEYDLSSAGPAGAVIGYALLSWAGQVAFIVSVPMVQEPMGSVQDPYVSPAPFPGPCANVLFVLPPGGYDAASTAIVWSYLTQRGHMVRVATLGGQQPQPDTCSLTGIGPGGDILRVGPVVLAMYEDMRRSAAFQRPWALDAVDASAVDCVFVADSAPEPEANAAHTDAALCAAVRAALDGKGTLVACLGRGVVPVAFALSKWATADSQVGRTWRVAVQAQSQEILLGAAMLACGAGWANLCGSCRGSAAHRVARVAEERGVVLHGPNAWLRMGSAWDDSAAFVVEDEVCISGRWRGDAWLLARRLAVALESGVVGAWCSEEAQVDHQESQ